MAAYNAFVTRLLNIPMCKEDYLDEVNTIKHIATTNGYKPEIIDKLIHKKKRKLRNNNNTEENNKYISIEYTNLLPHILHNELRKHNIQISFKTNNNIQKILKDKTKTDKKSCSGVYKINCNDCDKFYIGQTGRTFYDRFTEHKPKQNTKSSFAQHLIEENHNYTNFETNLTPIHICKKGTKLDALEEYEIYKSNRTRQDILLNDKLTIKNNTLYNTAINYENRQQQK